MAGSPDELATSLCRINPACSGTIRPTGWLAMPNYRRVKIPGGTHFFTLVTHRRRPLFRDESARTCLRSAIQETKSAYPFHVEAMALLPEHLHAIWRLPEGDFDCSKRWRMIKGRFTHSYREKGYEGEVWQNRFWEHTIRDDEDFARHFHYIHYNPVKHGLVESPVQWEYSSFHKYKAMGWYSDEWGRVEPEELKDIGKCAGE
jgi:putative transposase